MCSDGLWAVLSGFDRRQGLRNYSILHSVQIGFGAHSASYPVGTQGYSLGSEQSGREAEDSFPSNVEVFMA
jgi:hypothetical protein